MIGKKNGDPSSMIGKNNGDLYQYNNGIGPVVAFPSVPMYYWSGCTRFLTMKEQALVWVPEDKRDSPAESTCPLCMCRCPLLPKLAIHCLKLRNQSDLDNAASLPT